MQQIGLNTTHKSIRARAACVQVDWHLKPFLKKKLKTHKPIQCGGINKFHKKIQVIDIRFSTSS